jgi:3-oxoacyl-[acyl-carrier protein] reductase
MSDSPKTAIVTGGSRGIGRAVCVELARCGYQLVINYHQNEEAARQTLALVREQGSDGELLPFDVADASAAAAALDPLVARNDNLQVLVNNAGVAVDGLMTWMSAETWQRVTRTTLDGFFNCTSPVLKQMVKNKHGRIVNISSVSALIGNRGQVNYSAGKAGLIGATRSLAAEVSRLNVRVNVVAPGLIDTDMIEDVPRDVVKKLIPIGRIGKPEEVATVVRFLCSDDASYICGQVIGVNGGMA